MSRSCPPALCNENTDTCDECNAAAQCDDADPCSDDTCENGVCIFVPIDCEDSDPCTIDSCNGGACGSVLINCDDFDLECEDPGSPNTGETLIFGQLQSSITLCPGEANAISMPVRHGITTHDTPRPRLLYGDLRLSLASGGTDIVDILYLGEPYVLDSPIPVIETGHAGCGLHDWHTGVATFTLIALNPGEVTLEAHVDPDPECCDEGDGVSQIIAEVTITVPVSTVTIMADVIDQDDPTNSLWTGLDDGSPIYGGSEPSTADNLLLVIDPGGGVVADIVWSVEGPGGANYDPPPTGPGATEWELSDILNPQPGELTFRVQVIYDDGTRECGEFNTEIGVRTDDVIVVGWINPAGVTLPAGAAVSWTGIFLPTGPPVPSSFDCNTTVFQLSENDITPRGQNISTSPTAPGPAHTKPLVP